MNRNEIIQTDVKNTMSRPSPVGRGGVEYSKANWKYKKNPKKNQCEAAEVS